MAIIAVTNANFKQEIEQSTKPVVLDIYASWCGPCQLMAPIFVDLEKELGGQYTFAKLNVDEARDLSIKFGVTSIPTFIFLKDNKVVGKEIGALSKEDMRAAITKYLGK